jgi:threonine efflux protein
MLAVLLALSLFAVNVLTPGASFVLTISNAMAHGRRFGCGLALGLASADTLFALATVLGLATLMPSNSLLLKVITLCGGLWFVHGGLRLILRGTVHRLPREADQSPGSLPVSFAYRLGLTAGLFNPQALIFFSTIFVTVVSVGADSVPLTGVVVGVAAISAVLRCGIVYVFTQRLVQAVFTKHRRKVEACSGTAMTVFGAKLATPVAVLALTSF